MHLSSKTFKYLTGSNRFHLQKFLDELSETRFNMHMIRLDLGRIAVCTVFEVKREARRVKLEGLDFRSSLLLAKR
jgi:hypothetical protein